MTENNGLNEATEAQAAVPGSAAEALAKHEAAKMSRRAVLSKVGLQFGAAALLALSVDDLARKVTATIAARNTDSQVAQAVAQEFKNAGMAFADDFDSSMAGTCDQPSSSGSCSKCPTGGECDTCCETLCAPGGGSYICQNACKKQANCGKIPGVA